jgi:transposase-like protein
MASEKYTFRQFQTEYPDDGACLDKIMEMTYGGTRNLKCPGCGHHTNFHRIEKRRAYACQDCGHHIYPCVGTIFEKSRTPLNKWFYAMYLFTASRHGVPAREMERQLGVTYKCAWRICHELRKLMAAADKPGPLGGHVEIDETLIGGRTKADQDKTGRMNKTRVLGIVEREGRVRAGPIPDVTKATLEGAVKGNVAPGSRVSTDEWVGYRDLRLAGYDHRTVAHKAGVYVRGDVHTNSIEGYWSRLKNSIKGTHVHISEKHAWKYICEFSFRYNMRKRPAAMFDRLILAVSLPRLTDV